MDALTREGSLIIYVLDNVIIESSFSWAGVVDKCLINEKYENMIYWIIAVNVGWIKYADNSGMHAEMKDIN